MEIPDPTEVNKSPKVSHPLPGFRSGIKILLIHI